MHTSSAIGKASTTDHLGPASRGRSQEHITSYLDLKQHMGSLYLYVYVCHRFPGGPASGHHDSVALSPAVTFQLKSGSDPCSTVPRNSRRLQTYLGKQSRKRRMQIYPQRPCLSNKSKSWLPRSTKLGRGESNARRNRRQQGGPICRMRGPGRGNQHTDLRIRYRRNEELTLASPVPKGGCPPAVRWSRCLHLSLNVTGVGAPQEPTTQPSYLRRLLEKNPSNMYTIRFA